MADPPKADPPADQDLGGMIIFVPALELEWECGFEIDILFEPDEEAA